VARRHRLENLQLNPATATLSRPCSQVVKVPVVISIQYLRAVAAILVVFYHIGSTNIANFFPELMLKAGFGVDIFFVISGFVIWHNTSTAAFTTMSFMHRRFARVVLPYWLVTFAMFALPRLSGSADAWQHDAGAPHLLASLLFVPTGDWRSYMPIYSPGWTINYEMFFYLMFAVSLSISSKLARAAALWAALAALVAIGIFFPTAGPLGWYTAPILLEFGMGILIAAAFQANLRISPWLALSSCLAGVLWILFLSTKEPEIPGWHGTRTINWGGPAVLIVFGAVFLERAGLVRSYRPLQFLGDASYALYLTHLFSIFFIVLLWQRMDWATFPGGSFLFLVAALAASVLVGSVFHVMIEKPICRLARGQPAFVRRAPMAAPAK
jgi:exopolysaccharide production protein ExoZ